MNAKFRRIRYDTLNPRQREAFNFQKISAVLADYGFVTIRLTSDWRGADFIAQHRDGTTFLKVQLKGRMCFYKKYVGRGLHVCFPAHGQWYIYPHDELLHTVLKKTNIARTRSWREQGGFSFARLTPKLHALLAPFRLESG